METRSRVFSVAGAALAAMFLLAPLLRAETDSSEVPMTLRAPVTFGLWTEQANEDSWGKRYRVVTRQAPKPGRLGSFILYDAPGPGYFRQRDQFDKISLELLI